MKLNGFNEENNETYRRFYNCLWYREDSYEPVAKEDLLLPPRNEIMVVGHTSQPGIAVYSEINGSTIVYVDNSNNKEEIGGLRLGDFQPINLGEELENTR